ncbi:MAG: type-F conjugative transfer system secretin TraK [Mariprofundaceae bacterium]
MILTAAPTSAFAVQILDAADSDSLVARISDHDPNRIRIAGGFITTAVGPQSGRIAIETDDKRGQIFVRVNENAPDKHKAFTLFLTDAEGRDYTLLLKPVRIAGQSILIRARAKPLKTKRPVASERRASAIKELVRAMALDDVPRRCQLAEVDKRVPLWMGTDFHLMRVMRCGDFDVERYQLENTSDKEIRMAEQELYADGVAAVSVERMHLNADGVVSIPPGNATMVIIVREANHE